MKGAIARTVSTTTLLDRIASRFGAEVIETPVGFKMPRPSLMEQGAILAGEESGGLSIAGHIPEKDGILACLLMAEVGPITASRCPTSWRTSMPIRNGVYPAPGLLLFTANKRKNPG